MNSFSDILHNRTMARQNAQVFCQQSLNQDFAVLKLRPVAVRGFTANKQAAFHWPSMPPAMVATLEPAESDAISLTWGALAAPVV